MANLDIAGIHIDQLSECARAIICNMQTIAAHTQDPVTLGLVNSVIDEMNTVISEVGLLRDSLGMPQVSVAPEMHAIRRAPIRIMQLPVHHYPCHAARTANTRASMAV
jgi:hypothetical protein